MPTEQVFVELCWISHLAGSFILPIRDVCIASFCSFRGGKLELVGRDVLPRGLQGLHTLGALGSFVPQASETWHLAKSTKTYNKWRVNIGPSPTWQIM